MNGMYEELIEKLRKNNRMSGWTHIDRLIDEAAEAIEALQAENEQLQKERNAAIADMRHLVLIRGGGCSVCKHWNKANPKLPWCNKNYTCEFEWRGLEEGSV